MKNIIKSLLLYLTQVSKQIISSNMLLVNIYYFFRNDYNFEKKVTLRANIKHLNYSKFNPAHVFHLRRNIHRLEKGLCSKDLKNIFALSYIEETINIYKGYVKSNDAHKCELDYFNSVLDEYFSITEKTDFLEKQRKKYEETRIVSSDETILSESKINYSENINENYNALSKIVSSRHSHRFYTKEYVSKEKIQYAIDIARKAPSGCNRQPFHYIVISNKEKVQEINNLSFGTSNFENLKQIVAVTINHEAFFKEFDRHLGIIDASLSAMLFMLALSSLDISTCPINWPDIPKKQKNISKLLGLTRNEQVVMLIAFGYKQDDVRVPKSEKKSINQLIKFI